MPRKAVQRPSGPEGSLCGAAPEQLPRSSWRKRAGQRFGRDCLGWFATWPQERFEKLERAEGRCTLGKRTHELASGASEMGQLLTHALQ